MTESVRDFINTLNRIQYICLCNPLSRANYSLIPRHKVIKLLILNLITLSAINTSKAAGIAVLEQSVRGLGNAYSGGTAGGEDISTIYYNPAGLSQYSGTEIVSGGHFVTPEIRFKGSRSSDLLNRPLTGGNGGNAGEMVMIPNLYMATDLNTAFRFGLGITVPFGLGASYADNWQGRYEAINSQLKTIDINPAISYTLNNQVSFGFGLSAQYLDIELTNAIDFGTLCIAQLGNTACSRLGLSPQAADGRVKLTADSWSWGYNAGVMVKPLSGLRVGIAYRSKVKHRVKGKANFQVPDSAQPLTTSGTFQTSAIKAESDLPANLAIGAIYESEKQWAVLLDVTWTQWNKLDKFTIQYKNPSQPESTLNLDFKNTIRAALGYTYHVNPAWSIRSGVAYDESPVRNARTRTFRIPDSDRYWLTVGVGYQYNSNFTVNLAYAHLFIKDALIKSVDPFGHSIEGRIESQIDIFSAELRWTF